MIDELVENIRKAEKNAENIIHDANLAAKEMVIKANNQAAEQLQTVKTELKTIELKAVSEAERQAADISTRYLDTVRAQAADMIADAKANVSSAVDVIIRRIKSEYEAN